MCGAADGSGAFILFNPEAAAGKNGEVGAQGNVIRVGRCYCPATGNVARLDVYGIYDVVRVLQLGLGDKFQLVFRRYGELVGYGLSLRPLCAGYRGGHGSFLAGCPVLEHYFHFCAVGQRLRQHHERTFFGSYGSSVGFCAGCGFI